MAPKKLLLTVLICLSLLCLAVATENHEEGEEHEEELGGGVPESESKLNANKVGVLFVFFASSFLGVWTPFFIPVKQNFLKFGVLFSTGLFIGMSLLYLTPETEELFSELAGEDYPFPYLVVVIGIYLTWLCDLIVKVIWTKRTGGVDDGEENGPSLAKAVGIGHVQSTKDVEAAGSGDDHLAFVDVALILFALCFHAVFEGLAVGLASTTKRVWTMGSSIAINEFFEGMALGITLRVQNTERNALNHMYFALCASVVAPLGIAIGIILDSTGDSEGRGWAKAIGNGMAAGVFLFIALGHLIKKGMKAGEDDKPWTIFLKWGVAALGLTTNALLQLLEE